MVVEILVGVMELGETAIASLDDSFVGVPVDLEDGIAVGGYGPFWLHFQATTAYTCAVLGYECLCETQVRQGETMARLQIESPASSILVHKALDGRVGHACSHLRFV